MSLPSSESNNKRDTSVKAGDRRKELVSCLAYSWTLKVEATCSSETKTFPFVLNDRPS
jgi:hypothetical protein